MTIKGKISKLVRTHGSTWGRIRPANDTRDVFFNASSLIDGDDFASLSEGQAVTFEEQRDLANGMRAIKVQLA